MPASQQHDRSTSETPEIQETETGYLVSLIVATGIVRFAFEGMEQFRSHQLEAELTSWQEIPGTSTEPFSARINILSLSNRESYRRNLDDAFGKGNWTTLLGRACSTVKMAWQSKDRSMDFTEISMNGHKTAYLCSPFLVRGANIVFGQGNTGKTWLALALARSYVTGDDILDMEWSDRGSALFIDYEADAGTLSDRCQMLGGRPYGLRYWAGSGVPLSEQIPALKREVARHHIGFIVVDSAGLACGGEPEKAEVAIKYFNALQALGVPSLTLAHLRKQGEKDSQPFGSAYWHTSARQIWKVESEQDDGDREMGLIHTKWNNVAQRERPIGIRVCLEDGVSLKRCDFGELFEGSLSVVEQLKRILLRGEASTKELALETGKPQASVRAALNQRVKGAVQRGTSKDGSTLWAIQTEAY